MILADMLCETNRLQIQTYRLPDIIAHMSEIICRIEIYFSKFLQSASLPSFSISFDFIFYYYSPAYFLLIPSIILESILLYHRMFTITSYFSIRFFMIFLHFFYLSTNSFIYAKYIMSKYYILTHII